MHDLLTFFIDAFLQVCRRWRDAVYRKFIWSDVEAKLHLGKPNPYLYPSLVRRGIKRVQVLSLRRSLRELVNGLPGLESLNLSGCYNLTDTALDGAFCRDAPALKTLNLSLCKDVSDNSLGRIATHCKNLEVLDLAGCTKVTNTGLFFVSVGLRKIRRLNLRSCRQVSDQGIAHLAGIVGENSATSVSVKAMAALSGVEELGLQDCQRITDESLKHISVGLPAVRRINLSFCVSITDTGVKSLSRLRQLESLNLRSCDNVSDLGLGFLCEEGGSPGLRSLDVSFCASVTDAGVKVIAVGLPKLKSLSLTTCSVGDDGLKRVAQKLTELQELSVGQCSLLTDDGLAAVAQGLKKLRCLDLYGCPKVTDKSLDKLRAMPDLARLNLEL